MLAGLSECSKMAIKLKFTYSLIFVTFIIVFLATLRHSRRDSAAVKRNGSYYRNDFISSASNYTIADYLRNLTGGPHLAGTAAAGGAAGYVRSHFERLRLETRVVNYTVLLSYPVRGSVTAGFSNGSDFPVPLSEPGGGGGVVMPYHAYAPSGTAYGKAVFLNYGRDGDYAELAAVGVDVAGCVGIVRRGGGLSRGEAVERAAARGVAAVLMYTDGEREKFGVERGTVMSGLGDPLSPGWVGVENGEKLRLDDPRVRNKFPKVPSLPISMAAAGIILRSLEGAELPQKWKKNLKNSGIDFERVGPGPTMLNFSYEGEKKMATIHNIFGIIRGSEEPDRFVLLGNHRDAWTYGAVDPNSGTAALLDIARRYARLVSLGWNPRRTIMLCSWDAEEFGMIGSTEFVEQNLMNLAAKSVAYLNVDCAVQGPGFFASATPQLDDLLLNVAKKVHDPDHERTTIFETWAVSNRGTNIQRLSRVDSDFASFLQLAGIPSVDLYYGKDFPVYHTAFDSYDWMIKFGDPLFQRHMAVSGVWGLLGLHLADDAVLAFNYEPYAAELLRYTQSLSGVLEGGVSLDPIFDAIRELTAAAKAIEEEAKKLRKDETMAELLILERRILNDRLMSAERGFLDTEGLNGRQWFKHLVYGPSTGGETELDFFPGIVDVVSGSTHLNNTEREAVIKHEIWRVARAIQRAAYALKGNLT
nr:probable glutamate carboxypeptidase 2 [Ipomoea trifida]